MRRKKIAVIDLGTNTFHILVTIVSETEVETVYREKCSVKIGEGGISEGLISEEAQIRALNTLNYFKELIEKEKVEEVFATATSAIRTAKNGQDLVQKIKQATNIDVRIISGEEEAKYIFDAVRKAVNIGSEKSLIMDIGGGSVEFVICDENKIFWKHSFEIGAQRLLDLFHYHDPILDQEIQNLEQYLSEKLQTLIRAVEELGPKTLIGSSGSFDTLSDIYRIKYGIEKIDANTEQPFALESYNQIHGEIIQKHREDRMKIPGMIEMRVDMIVVACILIKFVITHCKLDRIRVSSESLKEGVLYNIVKSLRNTQNF
ncbi:exopolyphosphatase [Fulvivirgaceae bacterium BMA10]|uniref:Exopolyphosphatase n=1 Tax=Splendidivirga corallicola TaxID=3051826 RepID=A0ABT8KY96_9BACT|nr:exopolyphosphatase [Fulvivirgaceae bacterium BMA10]